MIVVQLGRFNFGAARNIVGRMTQIRVEQVPDSPADVVEIFERMVKGSTWLIVFANEQGVVESHTFGVQSEQRLEVLERIIAAYRERVEQDKP